MRGKIISYCCPGLQFICVSLHDSGCVTGMYGHVCPASLPQNYLSLFLSVSLFLADHSHHYDACITLDKMSQYVS